MHKIRFLSILLILLMSMSALAEDATDLAGDITGVESTDSTETDSAETEYDVFDADLLIGYVAASGASLNPFLCNEQDLVSLNQLVFESLVTLDDDQKPSPLLADNWTHEDKTWTFTLRSGITFHNGAELTAYDVQATYELFVQMTDSNPYSARITRFISSLTAVDDLTVSVEAKYSGMITLYAMTFPVVQSSTLYDDMPRGTGPYWYVSYAIDSAVRIESNPLWWKQQATIGSITFRYYTDSGDAIEGLQTGQVDMLATRNSSAALCKKLANLTSMDYGTTTYEMLVPNLDSDSPMSDVLVRQAVMYAIDRSIIADNAYLDMVTQSEVPILPGTWLYESQSAQYYYSPERAVKLLNDAGWEDLTGDIILDKLDGIQVKELSVTIITYNESNSSVRENAVDLIADYLTTVGFKVETEILTQSEVVSRMKSGNYDLALVAVNLDEVPGLAPLLGTDGSLNFNDYSDDTMDSLISQTATASDEDSLQQVYSQIQLKVVEDLPILGLYFRTGTVLSSRSLSGLSGIRAINTVSGLQHQAV